MLIPRPSATVSEGRKTSWERQTEMICSFHFPALQDASVFINVGQERHNLHSKRYAGTYSSISCTWEKFFKEFKKHLALLLSLSSSYIGQGMWWGCTYPVGLGHWLLILWAFFLLTANLHLHRWITAIAQWPLEVFCIHYDTEYIFCLPDKYFFNIFVSILKASLLWEFCHRPKGQLNLELCKHFNPNSQWKSQTLSSSSENSF